MARRAARCRCLSAVQAQLLPAGRTDRGRGSLEAVLAASAGARQAPQGCVCGRQRDGSRYAPPTMDATCVVDFKLMHDRWITKWPFSRKKEVVEPCK
ncbi:hypothetical protein BDY21DRAFT_5707 [Lineolata rhizophorae]|uniref:Uncharacterized protein n=1 Tax=Lineolata rhizophorae TaxID=578093 RepID=A0A6A6PE37_9PEZI|nr:hypothetical protein BDY21DRAFT_5707 [Lineolata rhizophorae]